MIGRQPDGALLGLAGGGALGRGLQLVIGRVAHHMGQGILDQVEHLAVELGVAAASGSGLVFFAAGFGEFAAGATFGGACRAGAGDGMTSTSASWNARSSSSSDTSPGRSSRSKCCAGSASYFACAGASAKDCMLISTNGSIRS